MAGVVSIKALKRREDEFERRVISYGEIQGENKILKRDLQNIDVHLNKLHLDGQAQQQRQKGLDERCAQLAKRYLAETVKAVVASLGPTNFSACLQRLVDAIGRVRAIGFEVSAVEETNLITYLRSECGEAVRAQFEHEDHGRIKAKIRDMGRPRPDDDPPTVVRRGVDVSGEKIPAPLESPNKPLQLDRAAIAAITRDTREVAEMLATAMNVTGDDEHKLQPSPQLPGVPPGNGVLGHVGQSADKPEGISKKSAPLPERYETLYEMLITRAEWPTAEAEALARKHGLMLSGAIEAMNDHFFDTHGGPLFIEEPDRVIIETAYLQ